MKITQRTLLVVSTCTLTLSTAACAGAQNTPLNATSEAPAAQGKLETRRTENQNTEVNLEVRHLAPPQKIASDATVYVVWTKPLTGDVPPQNVGSLVVDADRMGSLKTKTPFERFNLMVTPEPSPSVIAPSHDPVMKAKVER